MRRSVLLLAVLLAGCGSEDAEEPGGSASVAEAVEIVATDFALTPATVTVAEAGETTFRIVNEGATWHALEIESEDVEEETDPIGPGESAELTVRLGAGEYELYCPVGNHRAMGMEGTLVVGGDAADDGAATTERTQTDEDDGYSGYGG